MKLLGKCAVSKRLLAENQNLSGIVTYVKSYEHVAFAREEDWRQWMDSVKSDVAKNQKKHGTAYVDLVKVSDYCDYLCIYPKCPGSMPVARITVYGVKALMMYDERVNSYYNIMARIDGGKARS